MAKEDLIKITPSGLKEIKDFISNLSSILTDLTPLMRKISGTMHTAIEMNFRTEGARTPDGKWKEHSEVTLEKREERGTIPADILNETGDLLKTILPFFTDETASVATISDYAAIHNFGGQAGTNRKVTIEKREFMVLNSQDLEDILDDAVTYVNF